MGIENLILDLQEEIRRESKVANLMEKRLAMLPPGSLCINEIKGNRYCYQKVMVDGVLRSICLDSSRDNHLGVIEELMEKKTIIHGFPVLKKNIKAMEKCVSKLRVYHPANYKYGELLGSSYYLAGDVCIKEWRRREENRNKHFNEGLIHVTRGGKKVRSKSEVLIADALYDSGIEFKYEAEMRLANRIVYPDFEILHPKTHKLIWWEHLGMIDDPEYVCENIEKIIEYGRAGITLGKNLIITYETKEKPLTHEMINQRLVRYDLL